MGVLLVDAFNEFFRFVFALNKHVLEQTVWNEID